MNMIDITPIINAVIALLAAGVSVFLIPWIKSKTTDAQRKELLEWVKIGVAAAEQLYEGQGRGEEKKQYVLDFLQFLIIATRGPGRSFARPFLRGASVCGCLDGSDGVLDLLAQLLRDVVDGHGGAFAGQLPDVQLDDLAHAVTSPPSP